MARDSKKPSRKWLNILVTKTLGYRKAQKDGCRYKTFSGEIAIRMNADGSTVNTGLFNQLLDDLLSKLPEDKKAISVSVNMIRLS